MLEIVLVDDGSVDGSADLARGYARDHRRVRLVSQAHLGVGAARNAGVAKARGKHLAFCDADDTVLPQGYERLASALLESGSDIAIGSVTLQLQGQHQEPTWAKRSNGHRRLAVTLDEHPEIMANLMPGTRVFRRAFWDEQELAFAAQGNHSDIVTIVSAMLSAKLVDIIPSVVYRWHWREDGASLWQQGLQDRRQVVDRVAQMCAAGELVTASASEPVQKAFFSEILHTTVPDLVRAAVTRDDGFWETLGAELNRLLELVSAETYPDVPVEDRIIAWLCAHDQREAAESFLEYAFDNQNGYPHRMAGDRPHITLPFIDALAEASDRLTAVADVELRYRSRLLEVRWSSPTVLHLQGAAFVEYLGDEYADSEISLLLRDTGSGRTVRVPTYPTPEPTVNHWSARAHEDHSGGRVQLRPRRDVHRPGARALATRHARADPGRGARGPPDRCARAVGRLPQPGGERQRRAARDLRRRRDRRRAAVDPARRTRPGDPLGDPRGPASTGADRTGPGLRPLRGRRCPAAGRHDRPGGRDRTGRAPGAHRLGRRLPHRRQLRGGAGRLHRRVGGGPDLAPGRPVLGDGAHLRRRARST